VSQVLVVDRAAFFGGDWPQGFVPMAGQKAEAFLEKARAAARFVDRPEAERTPAWKQWIPYCVVRSRAAAPREAGLVPDDPAAPVTGVFCVQRTTGQGETRLHGAWSIGLGGHVEPEDLDRAPQPAGGPAFFRSALVRELTEELGCGSLLPRPRFVGLLNDDGTAVGQVHAGLVHVWDLVGDLTAARHAVKVREISKMKGGFGSLVEFCELWQDPAKFESWSQLLIQAGVAGPLARA
jgi:predicted NUDIX family phosphoesterase